MCGAAAYLYTSNAPMANRGAKLPSNNTDPDNQCSFRHIEQLQN